MEVASGDQDASVLPPLFRRLRLRCDYFVEVGAGGDPEFEAVTASLRVPICRTFLRVTLPICPPAILDILVYLFVNAMTTVSAVIFLYGPDTKPASVAVVQMDEAGQSSAAAAMAAS